ncbi:MAG TPA: cation:proton antiporter [Sediminispirochaeta sp.]|nr:cation:proton antiporter [Sediminispirochaeta sp.]
MIYISLVFLSLAILFSLIRLLKGPTSFDRLLASDTLAIITSGLIVLVAYLLERVIYMDVSLVYALLGFVGVVVVARFLGGDA